MNVVNSIRRKLAPIHPEGYLFVRGFVVATLMLWWIWVAARLARLHRDAVVRLFLSRSGAGDAGPRRSRRCPRRRDRQLRRIRRAAAGARPRLAPLQRVSIFMSVFDCHVNRAPVEGRVARIAYHPGLFLNADLDKASEDNERNSIVIDTPAGRFGVVQIAGLVARRIVCFTQEGARLGAGERFGLIRFGSRVDVYLPGRRADRRRHRFARASPAKR